MSDVALVTGCSSGFGLLTAVELARRGLTVFATMRDLSRRGRLDDALKQANVTAEVLELDVTRQATVDAALARIGRVDVLVNNAGYGLGGFVEDLTMDELRAQFETNFFGAVALLKAVIPGMRERRHGRVINVSSISGRFAMPAAAAYAASKHALEGLSEGLRHELLPHGVFVVLVEPGTFRTDIFERNLHLGARANDPGSPNYERAQRIKAFVEKNAQKSTQDPRDVALTIARAATTRRPRLRYLVGGDARVLSALRATVPERLWETLVERTP